MKSFDLVLIELDRAGREVCMAPRLVVQAGDIVETEFGRGKVLKTEFCIQDDEIFQMFNSEHRVHKVQSVMKPVVYDDDEDA